uniref:Uncharacterized protein n=1 Tax=Arundo donax TaxID=35708 RepID=A0A0A9AKW6_ARUDO
MSYFMLSGCTQYCFINHTSNKDIVLLTSRGNPTNAKTWA